MGITSERHDEGSLLGDPILNLAFGILVEFAEWNGTARHPRHVHGSAKKNQMGVENGRGHLASFRLDIQGNHKELTDQGGKTNELVPLIWDLLLCDLVICLTRGIHINEPAGVGQNAFTPHTGNLRETPPSRPGSWPEKPLGLRVGLLINVAGWVSLGQGDVFLLPPYCPFGGNPGNACFRFFAWNPGNELRTRKIKRFQVFHLLNQMFVIFPIEKDLVGPLKLGRFRSPQVPQVLLTCRAVTTTSAIFPGGF